MLIPTSRKATVAPGGVPTSLLLSQPGFQPLRKLAGVTNIILTPDFAASASRILAGLLQALASMAFQ
jgi:hypothetical protein